MDYPKDNKKMTQKQYVGQIGENIASRYIEKYGFKILDRNYRKKWGEIDIISLKDKTIHFIEVKTVSRNFNVFDGRTNRFETSPYRPEENVHPWKIKRLHRAIQTYLLQKKYSDEQEWVLDLIVIYLDLDIKKARVELLENIC